MPTTSAVASVTSVSENQKKSSWWPFSSRQEKETSEAAIADDANKPGKFYTVWKFHHFSITQIFCEIKFGDSGSAKSAILPHLEALNFDFL